jgi:hypothetical protein
MKYSEDQKAKLSNVVIFGQVPNDWLVYNAFNYQLNHNENFKSNEVFKTLYDRQVFNFVSQPVMS